jgi:hypothetical protein
MVICLQIPTVFWTDGRIAFVSYVHGINDTWQREMHAAEPLVPWPSTVDFEISIDKLNICKSPGIYQSPAELNQAGCTILGYEIHILINSIWNE